MNTTSSIHTNNYQWLVRLLFTRYWFSASLDQFCEIEIRKNFDYADKQICDTRIQQQGHELVLWNQPLMQLNGQFPLIIFGKNILSIWQRNGLLNTENVVLSWKARSFWRHVDRWVERFENIAWKGCSFMSFFLELIFVFYCLDIASSGPAFLWRCCFLKLITHTQTHRIY